MSEYSKKAKDTLDLLRANPEWIGRYKKYADEISCNIAMLKERKTSFHRWNPLYVYLTTSEMQSGGSISFSLRYKGQIVGNLTVKDEIICCPAYENNKKNFGYTPSFQGKFPWNSENAREFRKFFSENRPTRINCGKKNDEHRYESMLLTYFEDRCKEIEAFKHIRPVGVISGVRFPMPTPIAASKKDDLKYSGKGGGIDIFTRTGHGKATYLNIMELKDENHRGEEPSVVIKQAIAYATFVLRLLRSESGAEWYKLFGFSSTLPDSIKVYATCLMPKGYCEDKSFANQQIFVHKTEDKVSDTFADNSDIIELHYMYFDENEDVISNVETSLH